MSRSHDCGEKSNQIRAFPDICRRFADAVTYCGRTNHDGPAKPNDQTVFAEVSLRPVVNDNNYPAHFVAGRLDLDLLRPPLGHDYATAGELIAGDIAWILEGMSSDMSEKARAELFARARRHKGLQIILRPNQILPNRQASYGGILDSTMAHALQERVRKPFMLDTSSFKTRVVIDIQQAEGILTIVVPGKRLFSSTTYIFILWMVGTSLVLFAVASIFMRNQVRPIRRLAQAADAFGKGGEMSQTSEYKAHRRSGSPQPLQPHA